MNIQSVDEGEYEICYTINWNNILTQAKGSSDPVCFTWEDVETIMQRVPSNEALRRRRVNAGKESKA